MKYLFNQIILLNLLFIFNSCSKLNDVAGCWKDQHSETIIINEDGTLSRGSSLGTWRLIDNDRLNFVWSDGRTDTHTIVKINSKLMVIKYNGLLEYTWEKTKCEDFAETTSNAYSKYQKQSVEIKNDISPEKLIEILKGSEHLILPLPTNIETLKNSIGDYSQFVPVDPDDPSPWGGEYVWSFTNGFVLTALAANMEQTPKEGDEITLFSLRLKEKEQVYVPSYKLTLNKSSIAECKQLYGNALITISPTYLKLNMNGIRSYFSFTENGRLEQITQAMFDIENVD